MKKRVLITGAGGAIGAHVLAGVMKNTDWDVTLTDSFATEHKGYYDRITEVCKGHLFWRRRITIIQHDLRAPFTPRQVAKMGKIDYIINLASRSDVQNAIDDPISFLRNNSDMMITMLELARDLWSLRSPGAKPPAGSAFIHFSTDEVYGPAPKDSKGHPEWDAIVPSNPYSASKAAQEAYAISYWRSYNLPLIITNTMNNFGEMQAPSKFPAMIQKKIVAHEEITVHVGSDGESGTRYYLHSSNSADALIFILNNVEATLHDAGEIDRPVRLNIVGDKQISNEELVQIIAGMMRGFAKYKRVAFHDHNPGHDLHYGLDGTKMRELGWTSPETFEASMKRCIQWQKAHPEWMK